MKYLILILLISTPALARDSYTRGYYKNNGTYVKGYHRTTPDNTINNNYGTSGNVNPYTGSYGAQPRNPSQGYGNYNRGNGLGGSPSYDYNYGRND